MLNRERLIQLLGMLGSAHDGEVLNAGRLAQRFISDHKLTWEEIVNSSATTQTGAANRAAREEGRQEGYRQGLEEGKQFTAEDRRNEYVRGFHDGVNSIEEPPPDDTSAPEALDYAAFSELMNEHYHHRLTNWENEFFQNFSENAWTFATPKQAAIFVRVAQKLNLALPEGDVHESPFVRKSRNGRRNQDDLPF